VNRVLTTSPIVSLKGGRPRSRQFRNRSGLHKNRMELKKIIFYFISRLKSSWKKINYCNITKRELLSIVESIEAFHHYLYGRKFLVRTDHASLKWFLSFKDVERKLAHWMEKLQQYNFEIIYWKARLYANADYPGLSRRPRASAQCRYCTKIDLLHEWFWRRTIR